MPLLLLPPTLHTMPSLSPPSIPRSVQTPEQLRHLLPQLQQVRWQTHHYSDNKHEAQWKRGGRGREIGQLPLSHNAVVPGTKGETRNYIHREEEMKETIVAGGALASEWFR